MEALYHIKNTYFLSLKFMLSMKSYFYIHTYIVKEQFQISIHLEINRKIYINHFYFERVCTLSF